MQHVNDWQPPFILVDDCSDLPPIEVDEADEESAAVASGFPYSLMLWCTTLQLHVASFFDIERHGRKVHAFVISPGAAVLELNEEATLLINASEQEPEKENPEQLEEMLSLFKAFIASRGGTSSVHIGVRDLIIAHFIRENQKVDEEGTLDRVSSNL